ncbi:MAG: PEP-CTERM sorting domain-containing protein [Phycisphaerales bacterium]
MYAYRFGQKMGSLTVAGLIVASTMGVGGMALADTIVFQDTFNNGSVPNSDSVTGFWTAATANGSIVESAGVLTSTASNPATNNPAVFLRSTAVSNDFDFFANKLQFDLNFKIPGIGGTASTSQQVFAFSLASESNSAFGANDSISVTFNGVSNVKLTMKQNASSSGENITLVPSTFVAGPAALKGFRLILDDTNYQLIVYKNDGSVLGNYSGTHSLAVGNWGAAGDSAMVLFTQRADGTTSNDAWSKVEDLTVTIIPEPATLGLLTLGGAMMVVRSRR